MQWLKNHKYLILIGAIIVAALVFLVLTIRYARKRVNMASSDKNVQAFLRMIRHAEGTAGVNGYRTLFGHKLFSDFSKHPNVKVPFFNKAKGKTDYSTAAGAYQFLNSTWRRLALKLNLPDFSPECQDKAAIELIREEKALDDVIAGRLAIAIDKVQNIWASLPDIAGGEKASNYQQPQKKYADLVSVYQKAGGTLS